MTTFENGDEVRIITGPKKGTTGFLQEINPNPGYKNDDEYWAEVVQDPYYGWSGTEVDGPDEIELIRKAKDIPPRLLPTHEELRNFASWTLLRDADGINVDASDPEDENSLIIYGTSSSGRNFSALVTISQIQDQD